LQIKKIFVRKTMPIIYILYEFRTPIKYLLVEDVIKNMVYA